MKPLHYACLSDDKRPNMRLIEIKKGIATAFNGGVIVRIDLKKTSSLTQDQIDKLDGKYISMYVWSEIYNAANIDIKDDYISITKFGVRTMFDYAEPQGELFKLDDYIEKVKKDGGETKEILGYNPDFISIIKRVFESKKLIFSPSKGKNATVVFAEDQEGMDALLLPLITDGIKRYMI